MTDSVPFIIAVAAGMIRSATPVLLATVGECLTERAGIFNLGLEGIMLAGALTSVVVSFYTQNVVLALAAALLVGIILGFLHGVMCIKLQANQVATGIAVTIFLNGITAFFGADYVGKSITSISSIKVPVLADLPFVGGIFFNHDPLVYFCYLVVPLSYWLLIHTRFGLSLRAVGEDPRSAAAAGINVRLIRYLATMIGAALAALAGAYLSLVYAQGWIENITAGRGWIAVGLVMFATWNPWKALIGACLFGLAVSLQLRLQASGSDMSPYLLGMLPYFMVIAAMTISAIITKGKIQGQPAALGVPYVEQR
jgi:simple sugar transport system permease protein